jgi:D-alanyl-D-alanine dipeptidase
MLENNKKYVDLSRYPHVKIDLKYASTDNFMGEDMYGSFQKAFLHQDAARKFEKAIEFLKQEKPGWFFIVFDALRPHKVQWKMWEKVRNTPQEKYIADPRKGSPHNYGMALDLSLLNEKASWVDMGSGFDEFFEISEPRLEERFLKEGKLSQQQMANRLVLREVMTRAGFLQLPHEWWHYNALPEEEIREKYPLVE